MKILLIDGCQADRKIIIKHINHAELNNETIEIHESSNLTEAFNKIGNNNYDTIILDIGLPESDGIETIKIVIEHLKSIKKDIPIIILTAFEDYDMGKKAFKLGIKDYLIKGETETKEIRRAIAFATYSNNLPIRKKTAT